MVQLMGEVVAPVHCGVARWGGGDTRRRGWFSSRGKCRLMWRARIVQRHPKSRVRRLGFHDTAMHDLAAGTEPPARWNGVERRVQAGEVKGRVAGVAVA